jgi:hypothetical protein
MQTPIGVEIGGRSYQLLLHCDRTYKIEEERLAASEITNNQAETSSAIGDPGDVFH